VVSTVTILQLTAYNFGRIGKWQPTTPVKKSHQIVIVRKGIQQNSNKMGENP
jgi:hypothetical protein